LNLVPALGSFQNYGWEDARADLVAGVTVAAVAVPQAMAYALVAGLPPVYGLYTAIVMTAVGALFNASRQLVNGPTNAISIAVLSVLASVAEPDARVLRAITAQRAERGNDAEQPVLGAERRSGRRCQGVRTPELRGGGRVPQTLRAAARIAQLAQSTKPRA